MFASLNNLIKNTSTAAWLKFHNSWAGQYWLQLAPRERSLLAALGLFLLVMIFYALFWLPMEQKQQLAQQQLASAQQQWSWLNQQIPAWEASSYAQPAVPEKSPSSLQDSNQLIGFLNQKLAVYKMQNALKSMNLTAKGVKISLNSVSSPKLFTWLQIVAAENIVVDKLEITSKAQGLVDAEVLLSLP